MSTFASVLTKVRACTLCAAHLPLGPRPIVQLHPSARILIAGQAPGRKVHETGLPFNDASGDRLRTWLGISREVFYDAKQIAILPMGFCFPGTGKSGDLAPRVECAPAWRAALLSHLNNLRLTLVIGQYAQAYHFPNEAASVTEAVQSWQNKFGESGDTANKNILPRQNKGADTIPLPHPSPRNNLWLQRNSWFEKELVPVLQTRVSEALKDDGIA